MGRFDNVYMKYAVLFKRLLNWKELRSFREQSLVFYCVAVVSLPPLTHGGLGMGVLREEDFNQFWK